MKKTLMLTLMLCLVAAVCNAKNEDTPFNGLILDAVGTPLKNAKIWVRDKNRYAKSDKQGRFGLTNVTADDTLHLKYRKQMIHIPVLGKRSMRIVLSDVLLAAEEDQQLVDLGYGYVSRRECTVSHGGISGEELRRSGKTSILDALQGRIAGLNISTSGAPGAEASVNIRGLNSINMSSTPLYIVDGVVVDSFDSVSIYDVDYVEVLRDANMYGVRGANGVIIVHTRK